MDHSAAPSKSVNLRPGERARSRQEARISGDDSLIMLARLLGRLSGAQLIAQSRKGAENGQETK